MNKQDLLYTSPVGYRYGSTDMSMLWGQLATRRRWRLVWIAHLKTLQDSGILPPDDIKVWPGVDIARSLEREKEAKHDVVAELLTFSDQLVEDGHPDVAGSLHFGATSSDIVDTAIAIAVKDASNILKLRLERLIFALALLVERTSKMVTLGSTHLLPAEATTVGYRLATHLQPLMDAHSRLSASTENFHAKGVKGPVGTYSYLVAAGVEQQTVEADLEGRLHVFVEHASGQTSHRSRDVALLADLAQVGAILGKLALDMRLMVALGQAEIKKSKGQVGSSAMPEKSNPIAFENICSLARTLPTLYMDAWNVAANQGLERTLDDSASRRRYLPEAFLISEHIIIEMVGALQQVVFRGMDMEIPYSAQINACLQQAPAYGISRQKLLLALSDGMSKGLDGYEILDGFFGKKALDKLLENISMLGAAPEMASRASELSVSFLKQEPCRYSP